MSEANREFEITDARLLLLTLSESALNQPVTFRNLLKVAAGLDDAVETIAKLAALSAKITERLLEQEEARR